MAPRATAVLIRMLAVASLLALAATGRGADLTVTYRSVTSVYVSGGRAQGLGVGDHLEVVIRGESVAELEVVFVAERSASCKILREKRPVRPGDSVRLARPLTTTAPASAPSPSPPAPGAEPSPPAASVVPPAPTGSAPARPRARVRGGLSFGYYQVWDQSPSALDFQQRTARADVSAWDLGGRPYSFTLRASSRQDVRARTLSSFTPKDERNDRLYEAALRYEPPTNRLGFEAGRVGVSRFVGVGYLDGALLRLRVHSSLQVGGFYGRRADIDGLGFEGNGRKYGGFLRLAPGGTYGFGGTEALLAVVREFAKDDVSREYVSLESRFGRGSRWSVFQRAEVDLNRGWRKSASSESYQLSNLSLSANWRLSPTVATSLAYDNRRNYRTHLNRSVPEGIFDHLLHQGFRASLSVGRAYGPSFNANFGVRLKEGESDTTYSVGAGLRHGNVWSRNLSLGLDGAAYTNSFTEGALLSARAGRRFRAGHLLDLSWTSSLYRLKQDDSSRASHWLRLSGRGQLWRGLYLASDVEYALGDDINGPRAFLELGWQF